MSTLELLRLMNREDASIAQAVRRALPQIARAVDAIVGGLKKGGRLIYVGAGTSGRLAALDAAECPPTFGVPREMVQALVAGGSDALTRAVEGAEDSAEQAVRSLRVRRAAPPDVLVGISASGTTRYVLSALEYAQAIGLTTIGVTSNRGTPLEQAAQITIVMETGPEVISGSTRLKAGTAQKMVLNLLSTAAMVRLGHVYDNWMINVALTNHKLVRRAVRILEEATGSSEGRAEAALRQARRTARPAGRALRVALVMLKARVTVAAAQRRLARAGGDVRRALRGR
jgi:N-acetylmuramic acid 6-phosphate etherase